MKGRWLRFAPAMAASIALLVAVIGLAWAADDDEPRSSSGSVTDTDGTSAVGSGLPGAGGQGPRYYAEPQRITEGDSTFITWDDLPGSDAPVPEDAPPSEEIVRYHVGDVINGIRITDGSGGMGSACEDFALSAEESPLDFTYLPPNVFVIAEPDVYRCKDGALAAAFIHLSIGEHGLSFIDVNYVRLAGEPLAIGTGLVEPIFIDGNPGVAIHPEEYRGNEIGQGSVVFVDDSAFFEVIGSSVPLAELIHIAEGIKCEEC